MGFCTHRQGVWPLWYLNNPPCSVKNNQLYIWLTRQTGALREYYLSGVCSTTRQTEKHTHVHTQTQIKEAQAEQIQKENIGMQILHEEDRADTVILTNHWEMFLAILMLVGHFVYFVTVWHSAAQTCCFSISLWPHFLTRLLVKQSILFQDKVFIKWDKSDTWSYTVVARVKAKTKWLLTDLWLICRINKYNKIKSCSFDIKNSFYVFEIYVSIYLYIFFLLNRIYTFVWNEMKNEKPWMFALFL